MNRMVEMELFEIRMDERQMDHQIVVLREVDGSRRLPIVIGPFEARSIQIKISEVAVPRPMTHDLLQNVIEDLGGSLNHILITKLEDSTFYAEISVNQNGKCVDIDSRPSDAIALALRASVPIYVNEDVLTQVI